jgi:hypothetical protein
MVSVGLVGFLCVPTFAEPTHRQPLAADFSGLSKTMSFTRNAVDFSPEMLVSRAYAQSRMTVPLSTFNVEPELDGSSVFSGVDYLSAEASVPIVGAPDLLDGWRRYAQVLSQPQWLADSHSPASPAATAFVARFDPAPRNELVPSVSVIPLPSPIVGGLLTIGIIFTPAIVRRLRHAVRNRT